MEISFCERCRESIPDADFDAGKAVRVGGRSFHAACAFQRAFPGPGRTFVGVLALIAAAAATYAAVRVARLDADVRADRETRAAEARESSQSRRDEGLGLAQRLREGVAQETAALRAQQQAAIDRLAETMRKDLQGLKDAARVETEKQLASWAEANQSRFTAIEKRIGDLGDWIRDVGALAKRASEAVPPAAPPVAPTPTAPIAEPPPPGPGAGPTPPLTDPQEAKRRAAKVDRAIEQLRDSSDTVVFSAAMALGELGDLRAVQPLVDVLKTHKYYYARLAAASSLGGLRAADAMPALMDALEDKDTLVQTAVAESLSTITGEPFKNPLGRSKKELKALKEEWQGWWKAHEAEVRNRLNQPPS